MAWWKRIFSSAGKGILDSVGDILDDHITSKEEKAEILVKLEQVFQARLTELEVTARAEMESTVRVIEAEMQQDDNYTKRARPTIIYTGLAIAVLKLIVIPFAIVPAFLAVGDSAMVEYFDKLAVERMPLEVEFFGAWAVVCSVYAWGRTREKQGDRSAISQAMTGNGKGIISIFDGGR